MAEQKPLVLLDVDGVINVLRRDVPKTHEMMGYPIRIPDHMPALIQHLVQTAEVMWCTTWREEANEHMAPALGIEPLSVVTDNTEDRFVHWKWQAAQPYVIEALSDGRKVCWIEDFEDTHHHYRTESVWRQVDFVDTASSDLRRHPSIAYELREDMLPDYLRP